MGFEWVGDFVSVRSTPFGGGFGCWISDFGGKCLHFCSDLGHYISRISAHADLGLYGSTWCYDFRSVTRPRDIAANVPYEVVLQGLCAICYVILCNICSSQCNHQSHLKSQFRVTSGNVQ